MDHTVIFTDLDGTLLDHSTYAYDKALQALDLVKQRSIPLILCSSKTKTEIEYYRKKLGNDHPFVSENGGGIFIPKNYFSFPLPSTLSSIEEETAYTVIRLGARYSDLRSAVRELQSEGFEVMGFGDMTPEELAQTTKLKRIEAIMAQRRDFDEPFVYNGSKHELPRLFEAIVQKGFTFTKGRFYHILGSSDKGIAVSILIDLYKRKYGKIRTLALGDSPNDIPMLQRVDCPIIVQNENGTYDQQIDVPNLIKAKGIGPAGWNRAVLNIMMT